MKEVGFSTVIVYNDFHMAELPKGAKRKTGSNSSANSHEERFLKAFDEYSRRKEYSLDVLLAEEGTDEGSFPELYEGGIEELTFMLDAQKASLLINDLPIVYREVLTFRFVDGLGPKEISELIEESENVVSVRIHRALKMLKDMIQKGEDDAELKRLK